MNNMLSSWKEIAHFFGKGVRTVQRWEKTLDLPIRRPSGAPSNVVLARTSDLEEWMHRSIIAKNAADSATGEAGSLLQVLSELEDEVGLLSQRPQPVDAADKIPVERLRRIVLDLRAARQEIGRTALKRVA